MKRIKLFEDYISEKREDVGKYNTVKKVVAKLGRRPSEQELAQFITDNKNLLVRVRDTYITIGYTNTNKHILILYR